MRGEVSSLVFELLVDLISLINLSLFFPLEGEEEEESKLHLNEHRCVSIRISWESQNWLAWNRGRVKCINKNINITSGIGVTYRITLTFRYILHFHETRSRIPGWSGSYGPRYPAESRLAAAHYSGDTWERGRDRETMRNVKPIMSIVVKQQHKIDNVN